MAQEESKDKINAFACYVPKEPLKKFSYTPNPLKDNWVEIEISHSGVCHSDLHQCDNDWGNPLKNYPLVPGHEIVGKISKVGKSVDKLKIGQRVGVGPQTGSCKVCKVCKKGKQQLCPKKDKSYNTSTGEKLQPLTYGGFSDKIRVCQDWAIPIPDKLKSELTAPLLCAGITTWTPFMDYNVKPGDKVGILGVGGLGHVAVQFSHHLGCETWAISRSPDKAKTAKGLGADGFLNSKEEKQLEEHDQSFDFILSTISADIGNWDKYLKLLKPHVGKICMVGLPPKAEFTPKFIVTRMLTICGSYLASRKQVEDMLIFCARHDIGAMIEKLPMTEENVNKALKKVHDNTVRYRMVLEN